MPNPTEPTASTEPLEPTDQGGIDVILLAAGLSRRFGRENKLLALFRGRPLISRALSLALSIPPPGRVILVYSDEDVLSTAAEIAAAPAGRAVHVVHNPCPDLGLCGSVRLGVAASAASHYLFLPADQPLLDIPTVTAVITRAAPGRIVVPVHAGRPGNPALFSSSFREELLALPDGASPRILKERHANLVVAVEIRTPLPLADADTESDLRELERLAEAGREEREEAEGEGGRANG